MKLRPRPLPRGAAHAARIALVASLLIGIVYAGCVIVLDRVVAARLVAAVDSRLQERLSDVRETGVSAAVTSDDDDDDYDEPPLYLWRIPANRAAVVLSTGAPQLPAAGRWPASPR